MEVLTFNDVSFKDFNTFWDGKDLFVTPEKDVTFYSVVGRNGDLTISNNRFNNVTRKVSCFIREHFVENYNALVNFLYAQDGYQKFESTKEPDVYMMASFVKAIEPNTGAFLKYGTFELEFNFKPQKWLKSGQEAISVTNTTSLYNATSQTALPLILVNGKGSITINDSVLTLANNTSVTYIDCDLQDAYEGTINRNPDLTIQNGFPSLKPGDNTIRVSGCTIDLIPRWWRI